VLVLFSRWLTLKAASARRVKPFIVGEFVTRWFKKFVKIH